MYVELTDNLLSPCNFIFQKSKVIAHLSTARQKKKKKGIFSSVPENNYLKVSV